MPISRDVRLGAGVRIPQPDLVNLYGCVIGDQSTIGAFVEIQAGAVIGQRCKISSHSFICEGVTLEDEVFIGHGVVFINDRYPRATTDNGQLQRTGDWNLELIRVCHRASIGSHATILCGVVIGEGATIGAGSVVTRNVPPFTVVAGVPAQAMNIRDEQPGA